MTGAVSVAAVDPAKNHACYSPRSIRSTRSSGGRTARFWAAVFKWSRSEAHQDVYVERQNLTMRMHMHRFTRLTNALSKKFENHVRMVALYTVSCN